MAILLTTPQNLTNATRLLISRKRWDEDNQVISYEASLRTGAAGTPPDGIVAQLSGEIRAPSATHPNGFATVMGKNTAPVAGAPLTALLKYEASVSVSQAAFDAALAALKGTAAAFEAHLVTAGYLNATLAGS